MEVRRKEESKPPYIRWDQVLRGSVVRFAADDSLVHAIVGPDGHRLGVNLSTGRAYEYNDEANCVLVKGYFQEEG